MVKMILSIDKLNSLAIGEEHRKILFYEMWEPSEPQNLVRINQVDNRWYVGPCYEQITMNVNIFENKFLPLEKNCPCKLQWVGGEESPRIPLVGLWKRVMERKTPILNHEVLLRIRTYTIEPNEQKTSPLTFPVVQVFADLAVLAEHVMPGNGHTFVVFSRCNAEVKWIETNVNHEEYHFQVHVPAQSTILQAFKRGPQTGKEYWDGRLKYMWDFFITKEWATRGSPRTVSPLSVHVDGMDTHMSPQNNCLDFCSLKGTTGQSIWELAKGDEIADESWYEYAFEQCLTVKGLTHRDFDQFCDHFFQQHPEQLTATDLATLHVYQTCVIRMCTLLLVTHPYVDDHFWKPEDRFWKRIGGDSTVVKTLFPLGDCEDTAIGCYMIYSRLLLGPPESPFKWKGRVQHMQRIAAITGIPVGVNGKGRDPTVHTRTDLHHKTLSLNDGVQHMYCIVVPFPLLHRLLVGELPSPKHTEFVRQKFHLPDGGFLNIPGKPLQCAALETTIMTTAFYNDRDKDHDAVDKAAHRLDIQHILETVAKDKRLMWMNYTTQHPLSFNPEDTLGELVHMLAYRLYVGLLGELYPQGTQLVVKDLTQKHSNAIDPAVHHSFVARKTGAGGSGNAKEMCYICEHAPCDCEGSTMNYDIGIDTATLFQPYSNDIRSLGWCLSTSTVVPLQVHIYDIEMVQAFRRPLMRLMVGGVVVDPVMVAHQDSNKRLSVSLLEQYHPTKLPNGTPESQNNRIMVYAWRLFDHSPTAPGTSELMELIKTKIQADYITMVPYGNGYAFIFHWLFAHVH